MRSRYLTALTAFFLSAPAALSQTAAPVVEGGALAPVANAPAPKVDPVQSAFDPGPGVPLEILAAVAAERAALARRAGELDLRAAEIAFAAEALGTQQQHLSALKSEIEALLNLAEQQHSADITRLVRIYRAMKPAEAAAILSTADLEVSVLVIAAMTERDSGPVLAKMDHIRAQAISKIILERARLPGDQRLLNLKIN